MVSTFTPNIQLEEPARGDDVGVWDVPVNGNTSLIDSVVGAIATIPLNNSNLVLSPAQFQSKQITFNSTLTGSVTITFPTSFTKSYEIQNLCTGSSAFTITLTTTAANSRFICAPPGEIVDIVNDGKNLTYKNLGRIGSYMDWGGSSVPNWVSGCGTNNVGFAPLPYLNCDGTVFSSAVYPTLAMVLGGTTLPDSRGNMRIALNQGTGRVTTAGSNSNGDVKLSVFGSQSLQSHAHGNTLSDFGHTHGTNAQVGSEVFAINAPTGGLPIWSLNGATINAAVSNIVINNAAAGAGGSQNMPPGYVGGITMIRAA